jgi:hypothetical protein
MSALPPKADIAESDCHVRFVPKADIRGASYKQTFRLVRPMSALPLTIFATFNAQPAPCPRQNVLRTEYLRSAGVEVYLPPIVIKIQSYDERL